MSNPAICSKPPTPNSTGRSSPITWSNYHHARRARRLIWLIAALVFAVIGWASWATLDEVVVGQGTTVPTASVQTIQSLEGGIIREVKVVQGQQVKSGEILVVMDNTRYKSAWQESQSQLNTLIAQQNRLSLELKSVIVNAKLANWQQQVTVTIDEYPLPDTATGADRNARNNYLARLTQLNVELEEAALRIEQQQQVYQEAQSNLRTEKTSLNIVQREMNLLRDVVESGAVAEVELLKLQRDFIALKGKVTSTSTFIRKQQASLNESIADYRSLAQDFRAKSQSQLSEVESRLSQLRESQLALKDQLNRTEIVAPLDGTIKEIFIRTLGGVAKPGEPILEIVPENSGLIIETRINPQDIAFISKGLTAMVKFSAYDFIIYGGLKGEVVYVSADVLQNEKGEAYYRAHVQFEASTPQFDVIPGMQATVDIMTGQKTVLQYWLKPILRAKENALRER